MRHFFFTVATLLLANTLKAQTTWFAPDHRWTYHMTGGIIGIDTHFTLSVGEDTIVDGKSCKKLVVTGHPFLAGSWGFVYESGGKVYAYSSSAFSPSFQKIYDFTLTPGDTVTIPFMDSDFQYEILSIDTVQAGPAERRRQRVKHLGSGTSADWHFDILEGIGMVGRPFEDTLPSCSFLYPEDTYFCEFAVDAFEYKFECFHTGAGIFSPYNLDCIALTSPEPAPLPRLSLQPNPASDRVRFETRPLIEVRQTTLIDAMGRLVRDYPGLPVEIELGGLPAGMYWIRVWLKDGRAWDGRFVKAGG